MAAVLLVFGLLGIVVHGAAMAWQKSNSPASGLVAVPTAGGDGETGGGGAAPKQSPFGFDYEFDFVEPPQPPDNPRSIAFDHLEAAIAKQDWRGVVKWSIRIDMMDLWSALFLLALVAGLVWAIIGAQFAGFSRAQLSLYAVALFLGIVSATLTIIVVELQEMRGFVEGETFESRMIYMIAGIGLREEVAKLLCFLPLLFFLRQRSEIDALVVGAMVGLGFAINENVGYYMREGVGDAFGRLMSANFLHMAMTGLIARAAYRMMLRPGRHWEEFLGTFLGMVVFHGLYDAFISVPELQSFSIMSFVCLAVMAFYFCELLGKIGRTSSSLAFSPVAVLLIGLAVVTGCVYWFGCLMVTPFQAGLLAMFSLIGVFPIVAMFIARLRDY